MHGYGTCSPTYCDWHTRSGPFTGAPFTILFDFGGGLTETLSLSLDATGLSVVNTGSSHGSISNHFHPLSSADYAGTWLNNDSSTHYIPQLVIAASGSNSITVHGYGACSPSYCDWGTRTVSITGDPVTVPFDNINGTGISNTLTIGLNGPGIVVNENESIYGMKTEYFHQ